RDFHVTGVQTCALPIWRRRRDQPAAWPVRAERHAGGLHRDRSHAAGGRLHGGGSVRALVRHSRRRRRRSLRRRRDHVVRYRRARIRALDAPGDRTDGDDGWPRDRRPRDAAALAPAEGGDGSGGADRRGRPRARMGRRARPGARAGRAVAGALGRAAGARAADRGSRARRLQAGGAAPCRARTRERRNGMLIMDAITAWLVPIVILAALVIWGFKILREYQRAVIFTLGRYTGVKGPGLIFVVPLIQQMVRVDMRTIVLDVPTQDVISRDNVSVKVNAVIYFRVIDADKAVIQVEDFMDATSQLSQTTLRSVLGKHELDEMLSERDKLNSDIQEVLDEQTDAWGIKVSNVEIKHVDIDESMIRAIARQAEAERNRRAKIINAEGELQAAERMVEAAEIMARAPGS